jgi:hypothetical protein
VVNQVLTLIQNRDGAGNPLTAYGFYTPPDYRAVTLPGELAGISRTLFGANPDRLGLDYKLRACAAVLHASALADDVTADDPRLTYLPLQARGMPPMGTVAEPRSSVGTAAAAIGRCPDETGDGRLEFHWQLDISGNVAVIKRYAPSYMLSSTTLRYTDNLSSPITLPGSALAILVPSFGFTFNSVLTQITSLWPPFSSSQAHETDGVSWSVTAFARPTWSVVGALRDFQAMGDAARTALFGSGLIEPYARWGSVHDSPTAGAADRFAAILLALAARTAEARSR